MSSIRLVFTVNVSAAGDQVSRSAFGTQPCSLGTVLATVQVPCGQGHPCTPVTAM